MGEPVPELQIGDMPEQTVYIWNMYAEIKLGCHQRITYLDIQAYCNLYGYNVLPFEVDIIIQLDNIYWSVMNE